MKRHEIGVLGERLAGEFLKCNGYRVIATNYRCPDGEIDIVALHQDTVVFVEVRTRTTVRYGTPEESITAVKCQRLRAVASHYCQNCQEVPANYRIDVIAISMRPDGTISRIEHIENAVEGA